MSGVNYKANWPFHAGEDPKLCSSAQINDFQLFGCGKGWEMPFAFVHGPMKRLRGHPRRV